MSCEEYEMFIKNGSQKEIEDAMACEHCKYMSARGHEDEIMDYIVCTKDPENVVWVGELDSCPDIRRDEE